MPAITLRALVTALKHHYGAPPPPPVRDAWGLIVWESVGYLVDDERRERTYRRLDAEIGTSPQVILDAAPAALRAAIADGGMLPDARAEKLRKAARIALVGFDATAKRDLMKFPGIGEPGAEKILLIAGKQPVLALDSNGLRVLLRVGWGREGKAYAATYRSVREAVAGELPKDAPWFLTAHHLLRQHGQTRCTRTKPACGGCPVVRSCTFASRNC